MQIYFFCQLCMLHWMMVSLRCHGNSDCNKTQIIRSFHFYIIQLWQPFSISLLIPMQLCSNLGGIPPKKSSQATLTRLISSFNFQLINYAWQSFNIPNPNPATTTPPPPPSPLKKGWDRIGFVISHPRHFMVVTGRETACYPVLLSFTGLGENRSHPVRQSGTSRFSCWPSNYFFSLPAQQTKFQASHPITKSLR